MSGLFLIGVVLLWFVTVISIALILASKLKPFWIKPFVAVLVMAVLVPLPVVDEIIGKHQLKALCEKNGPKEIEFARLKNSILIVRPDSHFTVNDQILPTMGRKTIFIDKTSSKKVISFTDYDIEGGVLIHVLGISETSSPLTFSGGCFNEPFQSWLDRYQIKLVFEHSGEKYDHHS